MVNCPNCGSDSIYLKRQSTFGYGGIGNFGVGGTDESYQNACMNCGHTWDAKELFNTLQMASHMAQCEIDLRNKNHRLFVKEVSQELSYYLKQEQARQNEVMQRTGAIQTFNICPFPIIVTIIFFFTPVPIYYVIPMGIFATFIFAWIDSNASKLNQHRRLKIVQDSEEKKKNLRYQMGKNIHEIGKRYGLVTYELPPFED